jgi:zinc protease
MLFPPDHPLSRSGIGNHTELMAASREDVRAFYETWYVPANARLAIAGDFDAEKMRVWVSQTFGELPTRPAPARGPVSQPDAPYRADGELRDDVALPATFLAWHTPALYAAGDAELDVLSNVLTGSDDARLTRRLVYEDRSAQEVEAAQYSGRWGSIFLITAYIAPGHTLEEVEGAIEQELVALVGDRPPTVDEVERAQNNREMDKLYAAESLMGRAELLQSYRMHVGQFDWLAEDISRYRQVDSAAVIREASRLTPVRRARLRVVPSEDAE